MTEMAIYPGSFDPPTRGHLDIIQRGLAIFDHVVVAVANNPQKHHLFSLEERLSMLQECIGHEAKLSIDSFDGLLVDYVAQKAARCCCVGGRSAILSMSFMATMNRQLAPNIETMFMMTGRTAFTFRPSWSVKLRPLVATSARWFPKTSIRHWSKNSKG